VRVCRPTMLLLLQPTLAVFALAVSSHLVRAPPPAMLLGADGLPMKKGGAAGAAPATSGGSGLLGKEAKPEENPMQPTASGRLPTDDITRTLASTAIPDDLADFDPNFDPLAVERPAHDLAAASGRGDEVVWGAKAAESAADLDAWSAHMKAAGITRMLGLFTAEDAAARSAAGTAEGYYSELIASGPFDAAHVGLLDPRAEGAREAVLTVLRDAQASREKICVHCADGNALTSIVLADWLLTDYITGENYEEACHALAMRKRLAGVERRAEAEVLEKWIVEGNR